MNGNRVRIVSRGGHDNHVTLAGLSKEDTEKVDGMTFGQYWMTVQDGKPVFSHTHEPLPSPTEDSEMLPFWRRPTASEMSGGIQETLFVEDGLRHNSASITIQHLCGYHYTPEDYTRYAQMLEEYGFAHMRSRRIENGRFWEMWYLPGTFHAKGGLKDAIESPPRGKDPEEKRLDRAVGFLCRNIQFGTLDVCVQRAAMPAPD